MISTRTQRVAPWAFGLVLALSTFWAVTGPFRSHANWMYFEQDDFFYYLKVAQNFAAGHGSTFNGIVPTNGYHPLWMLLLSAVCRMNAGPHGILIFLAASIWIAALSTYILIVRLLRRSGIEAVAGSACAAFVTCYCIRLYVECMEVTLAIPLMLAVITTVQATDWWSKNSRRGCLHCIALGLLVSAMILSRLDTAIFTALLAISIAVEPTMRRLVRQPQITGIAIGLLPLAFYLWTNHRAFGVWMPISGMAKQLKLDHGFTIKVWQSVRENLGIHNLNFLLIILTIPLLPWLWKRLRPVERVLVFSTFLFPFVYFLSLSWLSDWQLWGWYFYSLRIALCIAILMLFRSSRVQRLAAWKPAMIAFVAFTLFRIATIQWDQQMPALVDSGKDLQAFAAAHPGIYAMGDRAGAPAYLLPYPMVQTEGLVMDRTFLKVVANQTPLREALAHYHVRYYVASPLQPYTGGCFEASEPAQAGPHAPHMRAKFCQPPLARWNHGGIDTLVFDLQSQP